MLHIMSHLPLPPAKDIRMRIRWSRSHCALELLVSLAQIQILHTRFSIRRKYRRLFLAILEPPNIGPHLALRQCVRNERRWRNLRLGAGRSGPQYYSSELAIQRRTASVRFPREQNRLRAHTAYWSHTSRVPKTYTMSWGETEWEQNQDAPGRDPASHRLHEWLVRVGGIMAQYRFWFSTRDGPDSPGRLSLKNLVLHPYLKWQVRRDDRQSVIHGQVNIAQAAKPMAPKKRSDIETHFNYSITGKAFWEPAALIGLVRAGTTGLSGMVGLLGKYHTMRAGERHEGNSPKGTLVCSRTIVVAPACRMIRIDIWLKASVEQNNSTLSY
ncbi:hypothetical protein K474DRAFT_977957 [Panus rudis PR-1116 ss-1]|nr:hypothetical protein K474DRAFT_977957 [Panus rudis PR-1116 ss-1]